MWYLTDKGRKYKEDLMDSLLEDAPDKQLTHFGATLLNILDSVGDSGHLPARLTPWAGSVLFLRRGGFIDADEGAWNEK